MSETPHTITGPGGRRAGYIGGAVGASILAWGAVAAVTPFSISDHVPGEIYVGTISLAATVTLVAVTLGVTYVCQREAANNDRVIAEAIGQLAAEVEAVNGKIGNLAGLYWQSVADEVNDSVVPLRPHRSN